MTDDFKFFVPFDVVKSQDSTSPTELRIAGYASTSLKDRQDDEIVQKGLDISEFIEHGWLNYDHDNSKILGYPDKEKCRIDSHGFYVEGCLLPNIPLAKSIWDTAVALQKSNAPRRLGFSIEGKTLKRDALGRIVKAKVYNVALTANPVNVSCTWDALVKSFVVDKEDINKSVTAGYETEIGEVTSGASNKLESLDSAFKVLAEVIGEDEDSKIHMQALKDKLDKRDNLTKSEMILYLQLTRGLCNKDAVTLVDEYTKSKEVNNL